MPKPQIQIAPPEDERFNRTFFLVEATSFERQCLWEQWHEQVDWKPDSSGCIGEIGKLDGRPVVLGIFWATINGQLVGFWEMTSQVADHQMVEVWFEKNCTPPKWDNGTRVARCNADNFHHCIVATREANEC